MYKKCDAPTSGRSKSNMPHQLFQSWGHKQLKALEKYTEQYSNNKIVPLRALKQGTYSIMALKKVTTRYGDKFIMILEIDGSLKICYTNKYLEDRIREHLRDETLVYIRHPQRGFITLYDKPLATLTIKGWG